MEAVAARDEVARELEVPAAVPVPHERMVAVEAVHADVLGVVDGNGAARRARRHQVPGDLGLAVDDHVLAAGEPVQVDALAAAGPADLDAGVDETLGVQARAHARFVEHRDRALLEDAGADPAEHVLGRALLEDDVVDAGALQQLSEQQAGGARADDGDLRAHGY